MYLMLSLTCTNISSSGKASNGPEPMQVSPVVTRRKISSNTNRNSYIEAMKEGEDMKVGP